MKEKTPADAMDKFNKAVEAAKASTTHKGTLSRLDNIGSYDFWAMSNVQKAIVVSDWNNVQDPAPAPEYWRDANTIMQRLEKYVDRMASMGYPIEVVWEDVVTSCNDCGGLLNTEPAHMWWKPKFTFDKKNGSVVCHKCEPPNKGEDES